MSKIINKIQSFTDQNVIEQNLENIFSDRFARYSKYIIQERALPDVRDGLKPVQRRILYSMYKLGIFSNKQYKKSARIVGDVIGKYHPHGDTAIYDALVRLSQNFKTNLPLIDMHGNNGSIDGDPAAAMRYTESRLTVNSEFLLQDINKHTVGFVPNFDDEELEPIVLPAKFPNILVNGATGISSGYATDIPPHNPGEIIDATIYRIENPECTLSNILEIVKGPDFPTGSIVQGFDGIKRAYKTGRGKIVVKSKVEIVSSKTEHKIIITEIPYEVNKAVMIRKMNEAIINKGVDGVKAIRDETDRNGLKIVLDIRKDVNPNYILNFLYKSSDLQINYNYNVVAICKGKPVQLGIIDILDEYISHQKEVITNRTNFELIKAEKRLEIVLGLIEMVSILDAVIATIRNSINKKDAKENIMNNYGFTELQAEAIVMLNLYKLTNTDILALQNENKSLEKEIKKYKNILSKEKLLLNVIKNELLETKLAINTQRKTIIEKEIEEVNVVHEELISKEEVVLLVTNDGYVKRISKKSYNSSTESSKIKDGDIISDVYTTFTTDTLIQFTNLGNYVYLPIHKIPEVKQNQIGYHISTLIGMETNEKVIFSCPISDFKEEKYVLLATKLGLTKRILISNLDVNRWSKVLKATKLKKGDEVISADIIAGNINAEVVVITKEGYINRYDASEISIMEPVSFGVKSIELKSKNNDYVVGAKYVTEKDTVLLLTNRGTIKRMKPEEINKGRKNNVGKMCLKMVKSNKFNVIDLNVIKSKNSNASLESYISCEKGYDMIDYGSLRFATADNGKKMVDLDKLGNPQKIVIKRNNDDL